MRQIGHRLFHCFDYSDDSRKSRWRKDTSISDSSTPGVPIRQLRLFAKMKQQIAVRREQLPDSSTFSKRWLMLQGPQTDVTRDCRQTVQPSAVRMSSSRIKVVTEDALHGVCDMRPEGQNCSIQRCAQRLHSKKKQEATFRCFLWDSSTVACAAVFCSTDHVN